MALIRYVIRPLIGKLRAARKEANPRKDAPRCVHVPPIASQPCDACVAERAAKTKYRIKVIVGLMVAFWLQALDLTIISPILLNIASTFHATSQFPWLITSFTLVTATFLPTFSQLATLLGRHAPLQLSLLLILLGSIICTATPTTAFPLLLVGRALQGLGCCGISVLVRIIIADRVSLRENAVIWSWFSLAGGVAYAVGPQIGGRLAAVSWRWCFAINIPVAAVAMILLFVVLRPELLGPQPSQLSPDDPHKPPSAWSRLREIDFPGQLLFIFGLGLLVLALTWAGTQHPWSSPAVLVPLILGALLLFTWLLYERSLALSLSPTRFLTYRYQQPMIPWAILSDRNILILFLSAFVTAMTTYAILYFCPIYLSLVLGQSPSQAGNALLFFLPGLATGAYLSIFLCNKWPRMTIVPLIAGSLIEMVGIGMLAWALDQKRLSVIYGMMALTSCGGALRLMAGSLHGIGIFQAAIPAVVSLQLLASPLGGTIGMTIMSAVFTNTANLSGSSSSMTTLSLTFSSTISSISAADAASLIAHYKHGLVLAVVSILPFTIVCFLACLTLGNVTLPRSDESQEDQMEHQVMREPYLWVWWTARSSGGIEYVETVDTEMVSRNRETERDVV